MSRSLDELALKWPISRSSNTRTSANPAGPSAVKEFSTGTERLAVTSADAALLSEARQAFAKGNYDATLILLDQVQSNDNEWLAASAVTAYAAGQLERATDLAQRLRSRTRFSTIAMKICIATSLAMGDPRGAGRLVIDLLESYDVDDAAIDLCRDVYASLGRPFPEAAVRKAAATTLVNSGRAIEALRMLERVPVDPQDAGLAEVRALALFRAGHPEQAERTLASAPRTEANLNLLGAVLMDCGRCEEAANAFVESATHSAAPALALANAAMARHYMFGATPQELRAAIGRAAAAVSAHPGLQAARSDASRRPSGEKMRVGLLGAHFHTHPSAIFSTPVFERLDPESFHISVFSDGDRHDAMSDRLRRRADQWTDCQAMDDAQLSERIAAASIDLLIDLSGHAGGRVGVIVRRPAPIQVKWVGGLYNTSGLSEFDWLISDKIQSPPEEDHLYSERVYRMPADYVVFEPPVGAPDPGPPPLLKSGIVTFASMNSAAKVNRNMVGVWAEIMRAVPSSRMQLKARGFGSSETRGRVAQWFEDNGIESDRLDFLGWTSRDEHLVGYRCVDIVLDTAPYSGGLTTCEALWMGCPVVTLTGSFLASRHAATHLSAAGLTQWIASSVRDYTNRAIELAASPYKLSDWRRSCRRILAESQLCDIDFFTKEFESVLRNFSRIKYIAD